MKRLLSLSLAALTCLCFLLATERRAYAYIDPGSGLLALQSFFAGIAAFGYFMRRRIAGFFGRGKSDDSVVLPPRFRKTTSATRLKPQSMRICSALSELHYRRKL